MQTLSVSQINEGRKKALNNAEELFGEAKILLNRGRSARALFLALIAIEELGKYIMLISAAVNIVNNTINWKVFWKRYRDHKSKTSLYLHTEYLFSTIKPSEYLWELKKQSKLQESVKLMSLYSDFASNHDNSFFKPSEAIDMRTADLTIKVLKQHLDNIRDYDRNIIGEKALLNLSKESIEKFYSELNIDIYSSD
jgi:AbiV family abortive infection protein